MTTSGEKWPIAKVGCSSQSPKEGKLKCSRFCLFVLFSFWLFVIGKKTSLGDTSNFYFALHLGRLSKLFLKKSASIIVALLFHFLALGCLLFLQKNRIISSFCKELKNIFEISFSYLISMLTLFCLHLLFFSFSPMCISAFSIRNLEILLDRLHI